MKFIISTSYFANRRISITDGLLKQEIKRRGWKCVFISPEECDIAVSNSGTTVYFNGKVVSDADYMIVKRTKGMELESYKVAKAMQHAGVKVFDEPESLVFAPEKLLPQLQRVGKIPVINSLFCDKVDSNTPSLIEKCGIRLPYIVKPQTGARKRGFQEIHSTRELLNYPKIPVLIQEMLRIGEKFRVIVLGNESAGCWYQGGDGTNKRNFGDRPDVEKLAIDAVKLQQGDIWGVDVVDTNKGLMIMECNRNPGFSSFAKREISIESKIIDYVISH